MASYLQIENISKSYGPKVLFDGISFNINEGDKIALIAPNGTGKTSLLSIIAGKEKSDSIGRILFLKDIRIAFLEQEYEFDPSLGILEQILAHRPGVERKAIELITSFSLGSPERKMGELSGGEVKRVAICEMLASEAEFLIMDEPTNHLDIEAIEYLEGWLKRSRCTLLMVTHDRYFLDRVCNTVMELDHGAIYIYRGDYQNYLEKREERIANYNAETDKVRNLLRRELEWIHATPCARTGKAKYRIEAFHELSERASQVYVSKQLSMEGVGEASRLGTKIINCKNLSYTLGEDAGSGPADDARSGPADDAGKSSSGRLCLLKDFSYNFQRYDKVGIVGRNGIGKTSFLNLLTGLVQPSSGVVDRGESLKIGYYRQTGIEFDPEDTVMDIVPDTRLLGRFLFSHDMFSTRIEKLSGGEKRRLYLLTILMKEPNLLILDEPTNDLDIVTLNVLEEYLQEFKGSLIVVSHDRHFLGRVVDHLLVFCGDGLVKDFVGKFSEYRSYIKDYESKVKAEDKARKEAARKVSALASGAISDGRPVSSETGSSGSTVGSSGSTVGSSGSKPRRLTWKEQREMEAIEAELASLEEEKDGLNEALNSGSLDYEAITKASSRIAEIIDRMDEIELRWLELSEIGQ